MPQHWILIFWISIFTLDANGIVSTELQRIALLVIVLMALTKSSFQRSP